MRHHCVFVALATLCQLNVAHGQFSPPAIVLTEGDDNLDFYGDFTDVSTLGGDDNITAGAVSFSNAFFTGEGNDNVVLEEYAWNNFVYLGAGDDVVRVSDFSDYHYIYGQEGNDLAVFTGAGAESIFSGGPGTDVIVATSRNDQFRLGGGVGVDVLVYCSDKPKTAENDVEIFVEVADCSSTDPESVVSVDSTSGKITIDGTEGSITVNNRSAPTDAFTVRLCNPNGPTTEGDLTGVDAVSVVTETCGSGTGDPHFVGFDGHQYDYAGRPGTTFNVIATADTTVNAVLAPDLVNGLTYMSAVGLRTRTSQCRVAALEGRLVVYADEVELTEPVVQLPGGVKVVQEAGSGAVTLSSPELVATLALHGEHFLDLTSVHLSGGAPDVIHGVLGQTANNVARGILGYEGEEEDYIVSSLWVDDFKYGNMFQASSSTASVKPNRKMGELVILADAFVGHRD